MKGIIMFNDKEIEILNLEYLNITKNEKDYDEQDIKVFEQMYFEL